MRKGLLQKPAVVLLISIMNVVLIAACFLVLVALTSAQGLGQCQNNNDRCNTNGLNCCNELMCVNNRCTRSGGSGPGGNNRCIKRNDECELGGRRQCCRNLQCKRSSFGNRRTCQ